MTTTPIDADGPPLRPFLWLRRLAVASFVVGLALLTLRQAAMVVAERRLQAMQPTLRAAGVPKDITELQPSPIPDADNAGMLYLAAAGSLATRIDSPRNSNYDDVELGPPSARTALWHQLADATAQANLSTLSAIRDARETTDAARVDWGVVYHRPAFKIMLPHLNQARAIANLAADMAERDLLAGDSDAAVERARDLLHLARAIDARPFVIDRLVSEGIEALAIESLCDRLDRLTIGTATGAATHEHVRALVAELLIAADPARGGVAYANDATYGQEIVDDAADACWATRPILLLDRPRLARITLDAVAIARTPGLVGRNAIAPVGAYPAAAWNAAKPWGQPPADYHVGRPLVPQLAADKFAHAMRSEARATAGLRAAAIAVAGHWYASDHAGRWPPTLDALAPTYLPVAPADLLDVDGRPFAYRVIRHGRPDGGDRPVLILAGDPDAIAPAGPLPFAFTSTAVDLAPWPTTALTTVPASAP